MLKALIANIQDAIVLLDPEGHVIFESPSAAALLGLPSNDVLKAFGLGRIHPEDRGAVVESFERTRSVPGAVFRATYRFQRGDGEWRHLEALAKNLLEDRELGCVLITFRDVTERIRSLEAAERAASERDEFLSRMSHELKTPLHGIIGWAQLLQTEESTFVREAADRIATAGSHLFRLVADALDLAAVQEGRIAMDLRPVRLGAVVAEALDLAMPLAMRQQVKASSMADAPADATVAADPHRLRQVLLNLLANGVKYNRPGGSVEIGWSRKGETGWRLSVRDTGFGIPRDRFDQLFERFSRLGAEKSGVEGSGLGLAISRRLVELMGGSIGVESTPGQGSNFWIDLRADSESRHRPEMLVGAAIPQLVY